MISNEIVEDEGRCSVRRLASVVDISIGTARKALNFIYAGAIVIKPNGRPKRGLCSSHGFDDDDDDDGDHTSDSLIPTWFHSIGSFVLAR